MTSEATATGTEDLGFDGDVEAAERALKTRGVQDYEGAAGDLATPRLLPVQQLVEPIAPSSPEVEPRNKHSQRVALGSTTGLQKQNQPTPKANSLLTREGNAAKIFPVDAPRGESLAKSGENAEDAQRAQTTREIANLAKDVVRHRERNDHTFSPKTPPFFTDASKIDNSEERHVHCVSITIGTAETLTLEYFHPTQEELHNMTKMEDFKEKWVPLMSEYFNHNYVKDEVTDVAVNDSLRLGVDLRS